MTGMNKGNERENGRRKKQQTKKKERKNDWKERMDEKKERKNKTWNVLKGGIQSEIEVTTRKFF